MQRLSQFTLLAAVTAFLVLAFLTTGGAGGDSLFIETVGGAAAA